MKNFLLVAAIFIFAFAVLFISIFDSSAINYPVSQSPYQPLVGSKAPEINYHLPYSGNVLPDSPLWPLKALRDKVWIGVTTSHLRRAELALLFSDKRLVMTQKLFEKGEPDIAISTLTKGEMYFPIAVEEEKIARSQGVDTSIFLSKLALSALKHREVAEDLIQLAPEDIRPLIIKAENYAKDTYELAKDLLNSKGLPVPKDPFIRD